MYLERNDTPRTNGSALFNICARKRKNKAQRRGIGARGLEIASIGLRCGVLNLYSRKRGPLGDEFRSRVIERKRHERQKETLQCQRSARYGFLFQHSNNFMDLKNMVVAGSV